MHASLLIEYLDCIGVGSVLICVNLGSEYIFRCPINLLANQGAGVTVYTQGLVYQHCMISDCHLIHSSLSNPS